MRTTRAYQFQAEEQWVLNQISDKPSTYKQGLDIDAIHHFALKNGLAPYLFNQLKDDKDNIPAALYNLLKKDYLNSLIRNTKILSVWKEINVLLSQHGLLPVPLKGIFLAKKIYPDPALRPMSDIDILFFNKQEDIAYELLLKNGGIKDSHEEAEHDKKTGHHLPGIIYKGILIEIHRSLLAADTFHQIPNALIKKKLNINGDMDNMHNFIYFCMHTYQTMRRGGIRLSWFLDLVLFIKSHQQMITSKEFNSTIEALRLKKPLNEVLARAEFLFNYSFGIELPPLSQKNKSDFISFIHASEQQKNSYSYSIAWERLKYTPGLKNKLLFIKSSIQREQSSSPVDIAKRIFWLSYNSIKMFVTRKVH